MVFSNQMTRIRTKGFPFTRQAKKADERNGGKWSANNHTKLNIIGSWKHIYIYINAILNSHACLLAA